MSSFPLPDHSSSTSSPEKPPQNVEHSTLQFSPITISRGKESLGPEPELQAILEQAMAGTGASGAAIVLSTEDAVCCRASTGAPAPEVGARLHAGISLTGFVSKPAKSCSATTLVPIGGLTLNYAKK